MHRVTVLGVGDAVSERRIFGRAVRDAIVERDVPAGVAVDADEFGAGDSLGGDDVTEDVGVRQDFQPFEWGVTTP